MSDMSSSEREILVQYGILKYDNEVTLTTKLGSILSEREIQRTIDTLLGTQRIRRIGPDVLQNNESHTELPKIPESIRDLVDSL